MKKILLLALCLALSGAVNAEIKVLAFAGSTRLESYNKKLVKEAAKIAEDKGAKVVFIDLKDYPIPFYDADLEAKEGVPQNAKLLRSLMIQSDAVIIASPEYSGSVSAVLKNALDWAARDENGTPSRAAFQGKKFAIMSASPGKKGGAKGLIQLRFILEDCGGQVIPEQVSLGNAGNAFNPQGELDQSPFKQELIKEIEALL